MPDDKKHGKKGKSEAKEQRKPRAARTSTTSADVEKKPEKLQDVQKSGNPEPGPEFYSSLKRETDDILKITEEANSKYKNKEILSNWSKYEMPIESYDEIDKQESIGADYEKLIQAPLTIGGDFQFKHEKSWDLNTGPSPYDKYFEINMENLAIAISTIPFYERNGLDKEMFSETDLATMANRSTKYKAKYYNDKQKYNTPEMEAEDKIVNLIRNNDSKDNGSLSSKNVDTILERNTSETKEKDLEAFNNRHIENIFTVPKTETIVQNTEDTKSKIDKNIPNNIDIDDLILGKVESSGVNIDSANKVGNKHNEAAKKEEKVVQIVSEQRSQVVESPENLEKWLDDFLDD